MPRKRGSSCTAYCIPLFPCIYGSMLNSLFLFFECGVRNANCAAYNGDMAAPPRRPREQSSLTSMICRQAKRWGGDRHTLTHTQSFAHRGRRQRRQGQKAPRNSPTAAGQHKCFGSDLPRSRQLIPFPSLFIIPRDASSFRRISLLRFRSHSPPP